MVASLRAAGPALRSRTSVELVTALGRAGRRFGDPRDPLRIEAEAALPAEAGFSPQMSSRIIDGMAHGWEIGALERLLRTEFPDPAVLDEFRPNGLGQELRAFGGTFAFHIGSGNVAGVGATSIIRSLLVKCPVLLKPGRGDVVLSRLLVQAIGETDPGLANAAVVAYWPAGQGGSLESLALSEADRVVAYGGNDLIARLRSRLPPTTPLVAYHHRLSIGGVARESLSSVSRATTAARAAASAVAAFDQRGCVSPQVIWVEKGALVEPLRWAELLLEQLATLSATLPAGAVDPASATQFQQLVGTFEVKQAAGGAHRVLGQGLKQGVVFFDPEPNVGSALTVACRAVIVKPIPDLSGLPEVLGPVSRVLQTFGLAGPAKRRRALANSLANFGLTRVTTFDRQPWPPAWWRHDGTEPLRALVDWVELEEGD